LFFFDQTGRVAALNRTFWPENLKIKEGSQLRMNFIVWVWVNGFFWDSDWFVQAEGRQRAEILVFRRLRMADQLLVLTENHPP